MAESQSFSRVNWSGNANTVILNDNKMIEWLETLKIALFELTTV
jgi:hypothetical protein